jgi:hypothetical protein
MNTINDVNNVLLFESSCLADNVSDRTMNIADRVKKISQVERDRLVIFMSFYENSGYMCVKIQVFGPEEHRALFE